METIEIRDNLLPEMKKVLALYGDVGWSAYTDQPDSLEKGLRQSLKVGTAWDGEQLVGLARVVGDGVTIIYLQDLLVRTDYQGKGLGSRLLQLVLNEYQAVRQLILLTDEAEETIHFYEKNGMEDVRKYQCTAFMK